MALQRMCSLKRKLVVFVSATTCLVMYACYMVANLRCSTSNSTELIQGLCQLYHKGAIAGNMCSKLCDEDAITYRHCGNNNIGKRVIVMSCNDCRPDGKSSYVVLKSKLDLDHWTKDNEVFFDMNESIESMISRAKDVILKRFRSKFRVDLSKQNDILSYIWRQDFNDFVSSENKWKDDVRSRTSVGLQSILALAKQEEYGSMLVMQHAPYIPKLYGSCGPAYFVEYTPSFPYLGYVLFEGKLPDVLSLRPKVVTWTDRARVALQMLRIFEHLDSLDPPVYMCDIRPHNFGINIELHVKMLDIDSLEYNQITPDDRVCQSDRSCSYITCKGKCNLTASTCLNAPINSHIQTVCRNIFLSHLSIFGLLRGPPEHIRHELAEILHECVSANKPKLQSGRSDELVQQKLTDVLYRSVLDTSS